MPKQLLFAIEEVKDEERDIDIPIMVSGTITDASQVELCPGQTAEAFLISVSHIPLCYPLDLTVP